MDVKIPVDAVILLDSCLLLPLTLALRLIPAFGVR